MPKDLPDAPVLIKQLLEQMLSECESESARSGGKRAAASAPFRAKSEQTADPATRQNGLVQRSRKRGGVRQRNEKEVVAPTKRRGKRKTSAPNKLTCACGYRKHSIGEEISAARDRANANQRDQTCAQAKTAPRHTAPMKTRSAASRLLRGSRRSRYLELACQRRRPHIMQL